MSICAKGYDEQHCLYRDMGFENCERCPVGLPAKLVMVCHECGAGFLVETTLDGDVGYCPECGGGTEMNPVSESEDVMGALMQTYFDSLSFLKKDWKGLSKKPLGVYQDSSGNKYTKLSFGRKDGWDI